MFPVTCKMPLACINVEMTTEPLEPYAYLCDLFTRLANGHLAKDIDALMPWAYAARVKASQ